MAIDTQQQQSIINDRSKCDIEAEVHVADFGPLEVGDGMWWLEMTHPTPPGYKKQPMTPRPGWRGFFNGAIVNHSCCRTHGNARYRTSECGTRMYVQVHKKVLENEEILLMYTQQGYSINKETCVCCACTERTENCRSYAHPPQGKKR